MDFKNYIQKEGIYTNLCKYGHGILHKSFKGDSNYLLNQEEKEDIISSVFEELVVKNDEITNVESFKKGWFANYVWNKGANYLNNKHKKKLLFPKLVNSNNPYSEYIPESKEFLDSVKDENLKEILEDKFYNELNLKDLQQKYGIKRMETVYKQVRKIKEKDTYSGIARVLEGKIDKCYPRIVDVEKDGFNRTTISKCVNGKLKSFYHGGYTWQYVKNLNNTHERLNNSL